MAWLPWSSSSTEEGGVKKTAGGAFESPSRTNRKKCYEARDTFFECLDKNNILDSINTKSGREKAETFCSQFDKEFEKNCAHSWVSGLLCTITHPLRLHVPDEPTLTIACRSSTSRNSVSLTTRRSRQLRDWSRKVERSQHRNCRCQARSRRRTRRSRPCTTCIICRLHQSYFLQGECNPLPRRDY